MPNLEDTLKQAREISWKRLGKRITFYLPGMFLYNGLSGRYPAVSITGGRCALQCDHCRAKTLEPMISATTPERLKDKCLGLAQKGTLGVLISGGCDLQGRLPWKTYVPAIKEIKQETDLYISVHCGLVDDETADSLKQAGVNQALIDVIGDDETYRRICHVPFGVERIDASLRSLQKAGLPMVPHIVCGLNYGNIIGERAAIEMISRYPVEQVVMVSLMRIPGTPAWDAAPPDETAVADLIAEARLKMPSVMISLGCARERGNSRMEVLAIDAGVNRMALPSDEAIQRAKAYGLEIRYQRTCCSLSQDFSNQEW
jgi:uncharacterized radical SAM superfamily protein